MSATLDDTLRSILTDILGLPSTKVAEFVSDTELFGAIPELDSMAVASLLTEMEYRFDITIDDSDVDGALFETFGNLISFVQTKKV